MSTAIESMAREGQVDLRLVVRRLWAARWWIVAAMVVFGLAFGIAAFVMDPVYRAKVVLMSASANRNGIGMDSALGQLGGLAALAGFDLQGSGTQTQEALAVLHSREFTEKFIRDHQVMPELFPSKWDANTRQWKGSEESWPTLARGAARLDKQLRNISYDQKTGLITVELDWNSPQKAAFLANDMIARLNSEMRARAIARTNASVQYLQKELAVTEAVDTRAAINRLMEAQINERMFANVTEEYALRIVDRALPPDPRDKIRPKRFTMLLLGPVLGFVFASLVVLAAGSLVSRLRP